MRFFGLVLAALREIFEESAYQRFLVRESLGPGRDAYRRFTRERNDSNPKVRCC